MGNSLFQRKERPYVSLRYFPLHHFDLRKLIRKTTFGVHATFRIHAESLPVLSSSENFIFFAFESFNH